jgi:hypothetical protein
MVRMVPPFVHGCGLLLLVASRAAAQSPVGVSYQADSSCPSMETFIHAAMQKSDGVLLQPAERADARAVVDLRAKGDEFVGHLHLARSSGEYVREMSAPSCEELASALAFVLGLAVVEEYRSRDEITDPVCPPAAPPIREKPTDDASPHGEEGRRWDLFVGGLLGYRRGLYPRAAITETSLLELRWLQGLRPAGRLALARAEPYRQTTPAYTVDYSWVAVDAEICPVAISVARPLEVRPCAGMQLGSLPVAGLPATTGGTWTKESSLWVEGMASLYLGVRVAEVLSLQLGVHAFAPFNRTTFYFEDPRTEVHTPPQVSAGGSLAASFRIR